MAPPVALTIAGSDSSGGAGIQADLKTFAAFGVYGASVITALTAQNTQGVRAVLHVEPAFVAQQLDAVLDDLDVAAAKTGMLGQVAVVSAIAERLRARAVPHLVVDPVMVATSGDLLLDVEAVRELRDRLVPLATLITPNLREAEVLLNASVTSRVEMHDAARALVDLGARAALVKGGHADSHEDASVARQAIDVLFDGRRVREFAVPRIATRSTHGTGCTLSAAVTSALAQGRDLESAVAVAKRYVTRAIETAPELGHGAGPLNHLTAVGDDGGEGDRHR